MWRATIIGGKTMNIHISRKLVSIFAGLGLIMLTPVFSHAGCVQSDLEGTWYTYAAAMLRCKIKVNSSGSIVASKSVCSIRDETGRYSMNVTGGNISTSKGCLLSGKMRVCEDGCVNLKIEHGRLERDKNMVILETYIPAIDPTGTMSFVGAKK